MIWRICVCLFIVAVGFKTLNQVTADYKLRPDESAVPEQAGVIFGAAVLIFLVLTIKKRRRSE